MMRNASTIVAVFVIVIILVVWNIPRQSLVIQEFAALREPRDDLSVRMSDLERRLGVAFNYIFHLYCTSQRRVLPTGGYCLSEADIKRTWNRRWDGIMCASLEKVFGHSDVLDLGAGRGHYGRCFLRVKENIIKGGGGNNANYEEEMTKGGLLEKAQVVKSWTGYDGALNIEEVSGGFIKYADLSQPLYLGKKYDWVLSLEVAEHIPSQYEQNYVENIIRHACKGIVISWAVPGQDGHNHVNNRPMEYVQKLFESRDLTIDTASQNYLRNGSQFAYYKHVFVFKVPKGNEC